MRSLYETHTKKYPHRQSHVRPSSSSIIHATRAAGDMGPIAITDRHLHRASARAPSSTRIYTHQYSYFTFVRRRARTGVVVVVVVVVSPTPRVRPQALLPRARAPAHLPARAPTRRRLATQTRPRFDTNDSSYVPCLAWQRPWSSTTRASSKPTSFVAE